MLPSDWNRYCIATLDLPFECHVEGRCWWFMIDNDTAFEQLSFCFPTSSNPAVEVTWGQSPAVSSRVQEMPDTVIRCFVKKLVSYQPLTMNHSQWLSRNSSIHKLEVYGLVLGLPQYRINQIGDFFGSNQPCGTLIVSIPAYLSATKQDSQTPTYTAMICNACVALRISTCLAYM